MKKKDKSSMRNVKDKHIFKNWLDPLFSPAESPSCHNGFPLDLDDHKTKWSRHRSFLYECDQSPGMHVFKLGSENPNLRQMDWSTKQDMRL